jgi:hypothetical protein
MISSCSCTKKDSRLINMQVDVWIDFMLILLSTHTHIYIYVYIRIHSAMILTYCLRSNSIFWQSTQRSDKYGSKVNNRLMIQRMLIEIRIVTIDMHISRLLSTIWKTNDSYKYWLLNFSRKYMNHFFPSHTWFVYQVNLEWNLHVRHYFVIHVEYNRRSTKQRRYFLILT